MLVATEHAPKLTAYRHYGMFRPRKRLKRKEAPFLLSQRSASSFHCERSDGRKRTTKSSLVNCCYVYCDLCDEREVFARDPFQFPAYDINDICSGLDCEYVLEVQQ